MKKLGGFAAAVALSSLAAVPATASTASALSLQPSVRAHTHGDRASNIAGVPIIALLGLVAIGAGAVIIATEDDNPDSP